MTKIINGKKYDTAKCEVLAEYDHSNNGNYSGTTYLLEARNGDLLVWTDSNGQDGYLRDNLISWATYEANQMADNYCAIDNFETIRNEPRLVELGLIEVI